MNILFCLTPKSEVDFVYDDSTLFKAIQTLEKHNYYAVPVINKKGRYLGVITANDILGCIKENFDLSVKSSADFPVKNVNRLKDVKAINANTTMEEIVIVAMDQNFVPVIDDDGNFIGIITRKEIINWMHDTYTKEHPDEFNNALLTGGKE